MGSETAALDYLLEVCIQAPLLKNRTTSIRMTHISELDNTLLITYMGILQKKEKLYSVTAIRVVNIGN